MNNGRTLEAVGLKNAKYTDDGLHRGAIVLHNEFWRAADMLIAGSFVIPHLSNQAN
jgi:hypothetical protein